MIHLICALQCEAAPLIRNYQLSRLEEKPNLYLDKDRKISLTVTGIGYKNAVEKTSKTQAYLKTNKSDAWLNVGTAGHRSIQVGKAVLVNKITCDLDKNTWYPQFTFKPPYPTQQLTTLAKPSTDYEDTLFDMEAAGFYCALSNYAFSELIHVLKIISDNQQFPAGKPDKTMLEKLIKQNIETIRNVITILKERSSELEQLDRLPVYYLQCVKHWHFTEYERNSLRKLLRRWGLICPHINPLDDINLISNAKDMLSYLQHSLDSLPVTLKSNSE